MQILNVIGAFLAGLLGLAALSLIVAPHSSFGDGVSALAKGVATDINAAKGGSA